MRREEGRSQGPTRALAEFAAQTRFEDLPGPLVAKLKELVLDTLGCGLFGATTPAGQRLARVLVRGGVGRYPLWGTPLRAPLAQSALANGTFVHAFDYDDQCLDGALHSGSATLPAALAAARDRGVGGRGLLAALAAGCEVGIRAGVAAGKSPLRRGWHLAGWTGAIAAAAAAGSALGLDAEAMEQALGCAATQGCGLMAAQYGADAKRLHMGKAAEAGLLGALLAAEGFSGIRRVLEVEYGGYGSALSDDFRPEKLVSGLGREWRIREKVCFKPFPGVIMLHAPVAAVEALLAEGPFRADEVAEMEVGVSEQARAHVGWEYRPAGPMAAQASIQYALARRLLDGPLGVDAFREEKLAEPELLALARRIRVVVDPGIEATDYADPRNWGAGLRVRLRSGRLREALAPIPKGFPQNPLSAEELVAKYREQTLRALPPERVEKVLEAVESFEELPDVDALGELLQAPTPLP
ncbi:MAG: MmgE/PrpD family protein [Nitrospinota bacterium]